VEIQNDGFATMAPVYQIIGNTIVGNYSYGNASYGSGSTGEQIAFEEGVGDFRPVISLTVENNLFTSLNGNGAAYCGLFPSTAITWSNNDVFNTGLQLGAPGCTPANGVLVGNLEVDPQFINTATSDFHTQRTSPVVAAGSVNAPGIPPADLDARNRTLCGTIDMGVYEVHPQPTITVTSSANPLAGGSQVVLSAHLAGNCNIPSGTITFLDGTSVLGTGVLDSAGNANLLLVALTVGSHNITATFPGDLNFDPSASNTLVQVVTGYPTSAVLNTVTPNPAQALLAITLSATVSSPLSNLGGTPTGTVTFFAGSSFLGSATLNAIGQASTTISTLTAGTYAITAVYNASTRFASSTSAPLTEVVNGATTTTTLVSVPDPSNYGQTITLSATVAAPQTSAVPGGTVTLLDGSSVLGTGVLSATGVATFSTSLLSTGTHSLTAAYGGSTNANASTSTPIVQVVNLAPTIVALTGTPDPADVGSSVALVAAVSPALNGLAQPSGAILFADQFGSLGSVPLSNGQAVLTTSALSLGTHRITATFGNSGSYAASTSAILSEVIQAHDFALTLSPGTLSVTSGQAGQVSVVLTSLGSFAGALTLSAARPPTFAALTLKPSQLRIAQGGSSSSTLSIQTASLATAALVKGQVTTGPINANPAAAFALAGVPLLLLRRRRRLALLRIFAGVTLISTLAGCGDLRYALNPVAPGTYVIPITAADTESNSIHTVNLTLIVSR
jgi:hypothetical protein